MKKSLRLMSLVAFLMLFATITVQAQTWTENGKYKISEPGQGLFMTINGATGALEWAAQLAGNDPTQVWTITDHRTPAATGLMEITANAGGLDWTMCTVPENVSGKNITLTVRVGVPVSVVADDYSGYDQFQRRKTTTPPAVGNNALFIKVPGEGGSRYGVAPSAAGDAVQFDGGGIDELVFTFIEGLPTAIGDDVSVSSNNVYPNPSANGIFNLKESTDWTVYSTTGSEVAKGSGQLVDIAAFPKGMYILKFDGQTKKIVF